MQGLDETPLTYIDSLPDLEALAGELASAREIAVDLEAHSYRSFQGFCCLMQLSTRRADYLVDALALRGSIGPVLGPVFADSKVDAPLLMSRQFAPFVCTFETLQCLQIEQSAASSELAFANMGIRYSLWAVGTLKFRGLEQSFNAARRC